MSLADERGPTLVLAEGDEPTSPTGRGETETGFAPPSDIDLLDAYSRAVVSVVDAAGPAVVSIAVGGRPVPGKGRSPIGAGSGVLMAPDGYVLTNSHVVASDFEQFAKTKLSMPVLVLTGEKASGNFLIEQARLVASDVRGQVVQGSGHWLMEEAPRTVIPAIIDFIN